MTPLLYNNRNDILFQNILDNINNINNINNDIIFNNRNDRNEIDNICNLIPSNISILFGAPSQVNDNLFNSF